jgi:phosphonate transport system substrate-binding protein
VLRVTTIPEEAATEQIRKFTPLASYLEKALGMKVEFTPVNDYPAAVEALVNKKVDVVWFGGFTHVQANIRSGGKIVPLAQREEDTKFQSVFIAKTDSGIKTLADMKGKQVSFGSQSSTSGHLMPRSFLLAANINPEKDFRRIAYSGAHDATIASVVSGKVDAAALDITVWKKFVNENKVDTKAVDVFYTTPGYFNYNWSVHADMPADLQAKVKAALLALNPSNPEHAEILQPEPRHPLHRDQARELQGPGSRCPQRRPALTGGAPRLEARAAGAVGAATRRRGPAPRRRCASCRCASAGRTGGGDRPQRGRQDHAAAGAGLRAAAVRPARCSWTGRRPGSCRAANCSACAGACSWRRRCRRCRRASAWSRPCWPAACRPWACGRACARCSTRRHSRPPSRRWSASTWPTSCSSGSTGSRAANASAWAGARPALAGLALAD